MTRRSFLPAVGAGLAAGVLAAQEGTAPKVARKGKLKQCVCGSVFPRAMSLDDRCRTAAELGIVGYDLLGPKDWPTLKKYGLLPTMVPGGGGTIPDALNRKENHDRIEALMRPLIDECSKYGAPNLITFSGNRAGMSDEQGMENCMIFLNKVKKQAEDKNVTICMELLNSKVNHKDYMCDHATWGIELMKRVNSPRIRLLYDIYHMQIMDGDIVRTIRENLPYFAHFHTGGNPGRHEIDATNELNYRLVAKTLAEMNYTGYIAHEYSPVKEAIQSLREAIEIMDA